jgi:hypothetical protein
MQTNHVTCPVCRQSSLVQKVSGMVSQGTATHHIDLSGPQAFLGGIFWGRYTGTSTMQTDLAQQLAFPELRSQNLLSKEARDLIALRYLTTWKSRLSVLLPLAGLLILFGFLSLISVLLSFFSHDSPNFTALGVAVACISLGLLLGAAFLIVKTEPNSQ